MSEANDDPGGCTDPGDVLRVPDGGDTVIRRRIGDSERVSDSILSALVTLGETAGGVPPLERQEPLYETLDVRALDDLFTDGGGGDVAVQFAYDGYVVTVCESGLRVDAVDPADGGDGAAPT